MVYSIYLTWVPMTVEEMKKFLGLDFHHRDNQETKTEMYRTDYFVFGTLVFPQQCLFTLQ